MNVQYLHHTRTDLYSLMNRTLLWLFFSVMTHSTVRDDFVSGNSASTSPSIQKVFPSGLCCDSVVVSSLSDSIFQYMLPSGFIIFTLQLSGYTSSLCTQERSSRPDTMTDSLVRHTVM